VLDRKNGFVWIGLYDLAVEDAHRAHQRPKLEQYEDSIFVVLRTAQLAEMDAERRVKFGETHVFVGPGSVVTVRHGSQRSHAALRARCEASDSGPEMLEKRRRSSGGQTMLRGFLSGEILAVGAVNSQLHNLAVLQIAETEAARPGNEDIEHGPA
jgi:hypothetical protein